MIKKANAKSKPKKTEKRDLPQTALSVVLRTNGAKSLKSR